MRRVIAILLLTILTAMPVYADDGMGKKQKTPEQVAIKRENRK